MYGITSTTGTLWLLDFITGSLNNPTDPDRIGLYREILAQTDLNHISTFCWPNFNGSPSNQIALMVNYITADTTYAPEPRSWLLLLAGIIACIFVRQRARIC